MKRFLREMDPFSDTEIEKSCIEYDICMLSDYLLKFDPHKLWFCKILLNRRGSVFIWSLDFGNNLWGIQKLNYNFK